MVVFWFRWILLIAISDWLDLNYEFVIFLGLGCYVGFVDFGVFRSDCCLWCCSTGFCVLMFWVFLITISFLVLVILPF